MKRKTTITLTIAGLLGLAGVLYGAGTYSFFSLDIDPNGISGPIGVAASTTDLYSTDYCAHDNPTRPAPPSETSKRSTAMGLPPW